MPVPIIPVGNPPKEEKPIYDAEGIYSGIDFKMLGDIVHAENSKRSIKLSDNEASLLFRVWRESRTVDGDALDVADTVSNSDILRLKTLGLVSGSDTRRVKFTDRAKTVINTLVLNEENSFESMRVHKPYSAIMADNHNKGKVRLALDRRSG